MEERKLAWRAALSWRGWRSGGGGGGRVQPPAAVAGSICSIGAFSHFCLKAVFRCLAGGRLERRNRAAACVLRRTGVGLEGALFIQGVGSDAVNYSLMCGGKEL